jgi:hypothetical protein
MVSRRPFVVAICAIAVVGACCVSAFAQDDGSAWANKKSGWVLLSPAGRTQAFPEDCKSYLNVAPPAQVKPGARLMVPNRERSLILVVIGSEPIVDGLHVVGTRHDSLHIELKGRPILAGIFTGRWAYETYPRNLESNTSVRCIQPGRCRIQRLEKRLEAGAGSAASGLPGGIRSIPHGSTTKSVADPERTTPGGKRCLRRDLWR